MGFAAADCIDFFDFLAANRLVVIFGFAGMVRAGSIVAGFIILIVRGPNRLWFFPVWGIVIVNSRKCADWASDDLAYIFVFDCLD